MSYEPTEWKTGDTVTSEKLNKLENGVSDASEGGALVVNLTIDTSGTPKYVLDKTWQEIYNASHVVIKSDSAGARGFQMVVGILPASLSGDAYMVYAVDFSVAESPLAFSYTTDSADGYPEYSEGT